MADKKISELPSAENLNDSDLIIIVQEDQPSNYTTRKTVVENLAGVLAEEINTNLTYNELDTITKNIVGAINEVKSVTDTKSAVIANPETASTILDKIEIDGNSYNIKDTVTTVTVNQTQQSGTEVGGIEINGTEYKLYAPTPTEVTANPQGVSSTDLEKISIGGSIYNIPSSGSQVSDLGDLDDVTITSPTEGQVLKYDSTNDVWINGEGGSSVGDLDDLGDVTLTSPTDGQVLKYDGTNQKWVNANESTGSTVVWNQITQTGTKIATVSIDGTPTDVYAPTSGGGGGATSLAGLDDVTVSSVSNEQDLSYDSTSSKWINKTHRVELTKAQYDALPSSKLTDGIEYFITDMETTGVEIVANPQDTATGGALTKLQIGDEIYSVGGSSAPWKDITGTLTAGQTSITLTDSSILESSTFDFYTSKFGVNPTDIELVNSAYNFTEFMNGKIVIREHKTDNTDKKLFFIGLEKSSTDIDVTDTSLLEYLSDITNNYKKASYSYSDGTTRNGNIGFYNLGNGIKLRSWVIDWTQTLAGTFYGMIDLNEAPSSASSTEGQTNTYSDPYDVSSEYALTLTFDEQSTDLDVKVRVTNETN